jgi:hypothetical protein
LTHFTLPRTFFRLQFAHSPLPRRPRRLGLALVVAAASTLFTTPGNPATLATEPAAPVPKTADIDVATRWLPNALRVVTITGPWPGDMVSIRLLMAGGLCNTTGAEKYGIHFLEHLVFSGGSSLQSLYTTEGMRGGETEAYVSLDHQMHEFDVALPVAKSRLGEIVAEWDRDAFDETLVEIERRRVRHELGYEMESSPLIDLAYDLQPSGTLAYWHGDEAAFVDTVSAGTLRHLFDERYVAPRLTLVVAANATSLSTLRDEIEGFGRIPAGAIDTEAADLSWLSGEVRTAASLEYTNYVGFRVRNPWELPSRFRYLVFFGVCERSSEVFVKNGCGAIDPDVEFHHTPMDEVWVYTVENAACSTNAEPAGYRIFEESLAFLGTPASLAWWRNYIEKDVKQYALFDDRPDMVADEVVCSLIGVAQQTPAPSWTECAGPVDPLKLIEAAAWLRERSVAFRVYQDKERWDLWCAEDDASSVGPEDASSRDFLLELVDLDAGPLSGWSVVTFFSIVMTASAGLGIALSGAIRRVKTRRFLRRLSVFRKRGPDEE